MQYSVHTNYYPVKLELELTSRCNVNPPCPMCSRTNRSPEDERDMSDELMNNIQNALEAVEEVSLHGVGEPLISKQFGPIVERVGDHTKVLFNSNGQIMTERVIDRLLSRPVHSIMFSLDATTEETYHKIRAYGDITLEEVKQNIQRLRQERDRRGLQNPELSICMVIMQINYREMLDFIYLGEELGCSGVYMWPLSRPSASIDYKVHERNGWLFDYNEQKQIPEAELDSLITQCSNIAAQKGLIFHVGR